MGADSGDLLSSDGDQKAFEDEFADVGAPAATEESMMVAWTCPSTTATS